MAQSNEMKVYLSYSIAGNDRFVVEEKRKKFKWMAAKLKASNINCFNPLQVAEVNGWEENDRVDPRTDFHISKTDFEGIVDSHLLVCDIGSPSTGVGCEIGVASRFKIPVLAYYRPGSQVSRFVLGFIMSNQVCGCLLETDSAAEIVTLLHQLNTSHPAGISKSVVFMSSTFTGSLNQTTRDARRLAAAGPLIPRYLKSAPSLRLKPSNGREAAPASGKGLTELGKE